MVVAAVFDAYGTLLDVDSATDACRDVLGDRTAAIAALWRRKQLEYSWLRTLMGRHADFRQVTAEALDHALAANGVTTDDDGPAARLLALYDRLAPFPDAAPALAAVRAAGLPTAVLSNGSPGMLEAGLGHAGLAPLLDRVLSVEDAGRFKPDPAVYRLACDAFACRPDGIAFVTANGWDAAGAAAFGFRVVWLNRGNAPRDRLPAVPEAEVPDLTAAARLLSGWRRA